MCFQKSILKWNDAIKQSFSFIFKMYLLIDLLGFGKKYLMKC